jgi:uncharacterized protein
VQRRCHSLCPYALGVTAASTEPPFPVAGHDLRRLDRRVTTAWWIALAMWLVVIVAVGLGVGVLTRSTAPLVLGLSVAGAVLLGGAIMIPLRYARYRYAFGPEALELQRGIWWRTRAAVPYHRIQHVDIEQGPLQRRLGLVSLHLRTAAASSIGRLPGLAADEADVLRGWLITRSGSADGA